MKTLNGVVISTKMQKTVVVEVVRRVPHPLYKKLIKHNSRFKADTGEHTLSVGDSVKIQATRHLSKDKYFTVVAVNKKEEKGSK